MNYHWHFSKDELVFFFEKNSSLALFFFTICKSNVLGALF